MPMGEGGRGMARNGRGGAGGGGGEKVNGTSLPDSNDALYPRTGQEGKVRGALFPSRAIIRRRVLVSITYVSRPPFPSHALFLFLVLFPVSLSPVPCSISLSSSNFSSTFSFILFIYFFIVYLFSSSFLPNFLFAFVFLSFQSHLSISISSHHFIIFFPVYAIIFS